MNPRRWPVFVALGALAACAGASSPSPQTENRPHPIAAVRDEYEQCVGGATRAEFLATREAHTAVERAFAACATEEQALMAAALASHLPPQQVAVHIAALKLRLKRSLTPYLTPALR